MIVYGTKSAQTGSFKSHSAICNNCGEQFKISFQFYRKHIHLFWIPIFPLLTKGYSECGNCKNVLLPKEMPEGLKTEFITLKKEAKKPIWQFIGLVLIIVLSAYFYVDHAQHEKDELQFIDKPLPNDIYHIKLDNKSYSTLKVVNVSADSIFVTPNLYEINKISKITRISKDENYGDFQYGIGLQDLKQMHKSGEITGAFRKGD